jgi:hypothetical protein
MHASTEKLGVIEASYASAIIGVLTRVVSLFIKERGPRNGFQVSCWRFKIGTAGRGNSDSSAQWLANQLLALHGRFCCALPLVRVRKRGTRGLIGSAAFRSDSSTSYSNRSGRLSGKKEKGGIVAMTLVPDRIADR